MKPRSLVQFPSEPLAFVSFRCHRLATSYPQLTIFQIHTMVTEETWWDWICKQKSMPSARKITQRSSPSDRTSSKYWQIRLSLWWWLLLLPSLLWWEHCIVVKRASSIIGLSGFESLLFHLPAWQLGQVI